jgi:hypothetical protein
VLFAGDEPSHSEVLFASLNVAGEPRRYFQFLTGATAW